MGSMPQTTNGASLWLVPLANHAFTKTTQELISDTVAHDFAPDVAKSSPSPHVTLCSGITRQTYGGDGSDTATAAQKWLDDLALPEFKKEFDECVIEFDHLEAGDAFFRKLVIEVNHSKNLTELAVACRRAVLGMGDEAGQEAREWANNKFAPHLSLMYSDMAQEEVRKKMALIELQIGWAFGSLFDCCGGMLCMGATLVLVDTSRPVDEWEPIASREMPAVMWKMSRNMM